MATLPSGKIRVWRNDPADFQRLSLPYRKAPLRLKEPEPAPNRRTGAVLARQRMKLAAEAAQRAIVRGSTAFNPADLKGPFDNAISEMLTERQAEASERGY